MNAQSAGTVEQEAPTSERSGKWWEYVTCIAISMMGAYGFFPQDVLKGILFLGELSLNGVVRQQFGICS